MKTFRLIIIGLGVILFGVALMYVDYSDFFSKSNRGALFSAAGMVFMIISVFISIREEKKRNHK